MSQEYPDVDVFGSILDDIPYQTVALKGNERFQVGAFHIHVVATPCHTKGHLAYVLHSKSEYDDDDQEAMENEGAPCLFSGDTLFVGGVGTLLQRASFR